MVAIAATRPLDKQLLGKDEITGTTLLAIDATRANAWVLVESGIDAGETRATAIAELARAKDGAVTVTKSTLVASASRIGARTADTHVGYLVANASASGPLLPKPALQVTGVIHGDSLRYGTLSLAAIDARFDTRHLTQANLHVDVGQVRAGGQLLGSASLDARAAREGDGTIDIAIDKHSIATAANGTWSGSGGRVRIEPTRIVVSDLRTGSGAGTIVANATIDRTTLEPARHRDRDRRRARDAAARYRRHARRHARVRTTRRELEGQRPARGPRRGRARPVADGSRRRDPARGAARRAGDHGDGARGQADRRGRSRRAVRHHRWRIVEAARAQGRARLVDHGRSRRPREARQEELDRHDHRQARHHRHRRER